jgi:Ca2+-binding EF-hand superfamily protein
MYICLGECYNIMSKKGSRQQDHRQQKLFRCLQNSNGLLDNEKSMNLSLE